MFIGGGVGNIGRVGGALRRATALTPPPPFERIYLADPAPTLNTTSWHTKPVEIANGLLLFGYSNSSGEYGVVAINPATGEIVDSAIILSNTIAGITLTNGLNDHFMVVLKLITTGPHAGKLVVLTIPHSTNVNTGNGGNRRYYQRWAPAPGNIADLRPATGSEAGSFVQIGTTAHNYLMIEEVMQPGGVVAQGTLVGGVINDDSPQTMRTVILSDPDQPMRLGATVYSISGHTSSPLPQMYLSTAREPSGDVLSDILFAHPSATSPSPSPIKWARRNLATGGVINGGSESGNIYTSGTTPILTWDQMPSIWTPAAGNFVRVHDQNAWGDYQARAVAITTGSTGGSVNAVSHGIVYCPIGDDRGSTTWTYQAIGAGSRAQTWDNGGGRRYNSDIRFAEPHSGYAMVMMLIARDPTSGRFRVEEWGFTPGSAPVMIGAEPWADVPPARPMRLVVSPSAATAVKARAYTFDAYPNNFTDFTIGAARQVMGGVPVVVDPGTITGTGSVGQETVVSEATGAGFPNPTLQYRWLRANDNAGAGAAVIPDATSAGYTRVPDDGGKFNQRQVRAVIGGTASDWVGTNWAGPVGTGFNPADLGPFIEFPIAGITSAGTPPRASAWASITDGGGLSGSLAQANSGEQPEVVTSPFNGLKFVNSRGDDLAGTNLTTGALAGIVGGKSAVALVMPFVIEATPPAAAMLFGISRSGSGGANQARWAVNVTTAGTITGTTRRADGDGAATTGGFTYTTGVQYWAMLVANYDTTSPTLRLRIYSADGATLLSETSATPTNLAGTSSVGDSLAITLGRTIAGTPTTVSSITRMPNIYTRTAGAFSEQNLTDILARCVAQLSGGL